MGRWKRWLLAAVWIASVLAPAGLAQASSSPLIAFTSDRDHPLGGPVPSGYPLIYTMNADGTGAQRLTFNSVGDSDSSPDWSYDGTKIAFIRNSHVWSMSADGTNQTQLTTGSGMADFHPSWAPDGTKIAYEHRAGGSSQIYVMNADGSDPQPLTDTAPYDNTTPSWSPDGTKIAFASIRQPPNFISQIYVMGADGSNQVPLTSSTAPSGDSAPAWSPDGQKIAFVGDVVSGNTHSPHIFVMDADGTNAVQITNGGGSGEAGPTWSPDGTQIAFSASYPPMPNVFAPSQVYKVSSDGTGPVTNLSNNSNQEGSPAFQKATLLGVSAGNPVAEPASGSVPATFMVTLPGAQSADITVHYKTLDGTAKASQNAYTPIADGSVTIPQGQTSAQIQVQVNNGSGQATTPTESFQVQLTSASGGLQIGDATATGVITIPGISGKLTDDTGAVQPNHALTLTGTATSGQAVTQDLITDGGGRYQLYADPGTYTLTPDPLGGKQESYEPIGCPGTASAGACTKFALDPGANLAIDFKLLTLVVNSTLDSEDTAQAALGSCDVTPAQPGQTCTLRQAIEVANTLGGGSITFNIPGSGVPTVVLQSALPTLSTPITIDGTTQPGAGIVALRPGGTVGTGLAIVTTAVTVRGMRVFGFGSADLSIGDGAGNDVIQGDEIDTVPGVAPPSNAAIDEFRSAGHNTFTQNTVGNTATATLDPSLNLNDPRDTVGGPGQGNTIDGGTQRAPARILGAGAVIQGNRFNDAIIVAGDGATVGGATPTPGTGAGNVISTATSAGGRIPGLDVGTGDVVQGNEISGADTGILIYGDHVTIGGAKPQLGNEIIGNRTGIGIGLTRLGQTPTPSPGNVVENNRIVGNDLGDGGVAVYDGVGNHIFENEIDNNRAANINLGGGPYRYNTLSGSPNGPNHFQPYPELLDVTSGPTVTLTAQLFGGLAKAQASYTIDLYAQATSCQDSVSEGQAYEWLGSAHVRADGIGTVNVKLTVSRSRAQHLHGPTLVSHPAFTVTATAADGSTSELSPCLMLGHKAPSFTRSGVSTTSSTITVTTASAPGARDRAARAAAKPTHATATLRLLCPPVTTRFCAGRVTLATTGRTRITIARRSFRLAPGQVGSFALPISAHLLATLKRSHRIHATLLVDAHDGARHQHRKRTKARLTLILQR